MENKTTNEQAQAPIKVSVIMPIYNKTQYLEDALKSVQMQTLREIEIICVDDGSTDSAAELLAAYQYEDRRIRIVSENNAGPAAARNNGLSHAVGEYVAFLDSDDFFEPTMLEKLYRLATEQKLDIAICRYDLYHQRKGQFCDNIGADHSEIFEGGKVTSKSEYPDVILQSTAGYVWNKLFRRSFLVEKNLAFPEEIRVFEDVYFTSTALSLAERVAKTAEKLAHHRVYSDQARTLLFRRYFAQIPEMFLDIKQFLMHHGLYAPLSKSYLNFSASRCYKVFTLLPHDHKREFWTLLHDKYAEALGWDTAETEDFENEDVATFCADVELHTYTRYMRLKARGMLSPKRWKTALTSTRWSKKAGQKIHQFFDNIKPQKIDKGNDPEI